jgi:MarR family transcriptional regulator, transcriptional regulator for hemolysin
VPESPTLGFLIHDIGRMLRAEFAKRAVDLQLTQTQWRAIAYLARMEGCRQNELAEVIEVRPITVCRLLDRLAAADLIERRADPDDRRASRLFLTARARAKVERLRAIADGITKRALTGVSAADREKLLDLLVLVRRTLAGNRGADAPQVAEERVHGRA